MRRSILHTIFLCVSYRFLYLIGALIFIGASIGCAITGNIWLLIVFRCFQSVGASGKVNRSFIILSFNMTDDSIVTMSVGAGTVADCWKIAERGSAFSFLFIGLFLGPLMGQCLL
jgi:MFS family permease